ncbi:MAG: uridine kinase [Pseudomonadota bacterium]
MPCLVAIAGPSGSGKTLFAQSLEEQLSGALRPHSVVTLAEDSYYRDQSDLSFQAREQRNYDHPDAIEQDLMAQHLRVLREGNSVQVPVYDYARHTRAEEKRSVDPAPILIVEGILVLTNAELRSLVDLKLFIDAPLDVCLLRRMQRDVQERARTIESVAQQYLATVRPGYHNFVRPSAEHADLVVTGGGRNSVALDTVRRAILGRVREASEV